MSWPLIHGESVCGDGLAFIHKIDAAFCIAVDGLGHGSGAAEAAEAALGLFHEHSEKSPRELVHRLHSALRVTRGAVVGVAEINFETRKLRYCGVGKYLGIDFERRKNRRVLVSHNGNFGRTPL